MLHSLTQVYMFLDKMSIYTELYKHKPSDVLSREDETLWRRQAPKLLYPLGQCGGSVLEYMNVHVHFG